MSMKHGKRFSPFVTHDLSFDHEEAMRYAPKVMHYVVNNVFASYNNCDFRSLYHNIVSFGTDAVTDKLCELYPEESYQKLYRWADRFSSRYIRKHWEDRCKKQVAVLQ